MLVSIFQSPPRQPGGVVGADVKPWPVYIYIYVKKKKKKKKKKKNNIGECKCLH